MKTDGRYGLVGPDAPVKNADEDRYGLTAVAKGLAQAIQAMDDEGSAVIGIEGVWGSGKTSLINLLLQELEKTKPEKTHVLHISPWLNGDGISPVASLLMPVALILDREQTRTLSEREQKFKSTKKTLNETKDRVLRYVRSTARLAQPLADMASIIPLLGGADKITEALTKLGSDSEKSAADLRSEIESSLEELQLTFIIVLDDLDRLEPAQAVEILRMVRSVADFPRFRYVMCYDRDVLAKAIEHGLGVTDGRLYLQKIVQLSFSLPRPEAFDLHREFLAGALELYKKIQGRDLDTEAFAVLNKAVDAYGNEFSTPREVRLALNALQFRYPAMRDYVYFPDLCFLQLIRVVNPGLHDWIEHYLTERSIVESGDGAINSADQNAMTDDLATKLALFKYSSGRNAWTLGKWVPGVQGGGDKNISVFSEIDENKRDELTTLRRLGSAGYWRYYFSFSAPQNVLSESAIQEILSMAGNDEEKLAQRLLGEIHSKGVSSQTWFEHIITRLTPRVIAEAKPKQLFGLLNFFFQQGDVVEAKFEARDPFYRPQESGTRALALQLTKQLLIEDRTPLCTFLEVKIKKGEALRWIAQFGQSLLTPLQPKSMEPHDVPSFSASELNTLRRLLAERMDNDDVKNQLLNIPHLLSYLYAWRDIASLDVVKAWVANVSKTDADFLQLLLAIRNTLITGDREAYRILEIEKIAVFFDEEADPAQRLEKLAEANIPSLSGPLAEVNEAIRLAAPFGGPF
ncbi:P-loop NTPase fold protein [Kosakonia sp. R1.Fl]|nr:P-loop NTPase fold protein [Kosakonia sp. R1.Fl]MCL6744394.1 P-loop NTPase fold protein [Kosakonia sp. R1.Fl]